MVAGTALRDFRFTDDETGQSITVNLEVQKGVELKLLEKINDNLTRLNSKR
jgi:hypothetical protein